MTLRFPNPTRSFDEGRNAVQFVGYDGLFEIRFFVEANALASESVQAGQSAEAKCLSAFDRLRVSIQAAATTAYSRSGLKSYTLSAANFR
jgi:hypothetical protein